MPHIYSNYEYANIRCLFIYGLCNSHAEAVEDKHLNDFYIGERLIKTMSLDKIENIVNLVDKDAITS